MDGSNDSFSLSSSSITQCVTLKLTSSNYLLWKTQFETFLSSQMLLGYVTGSTPRPSSTISVRTGEAVTESANPEFVKWIQKDQLVKSWLFGSLSEDALRMVYGLQSSQEVWYALGQNFNRVSASRKFDLQRRLQTCSKQGKTMAEYLREVKTICDQLDSIGYPVPDQEKIYGILNGLGKEYEAVAAVIEHSLDLFPCPSFDDVVYLLTGFEDRLQNYASSATSVNTHMAFAVNNAADLSGKVVVHHISSKHQLADIFTKSLPITAFKELRFKLGVDQRPTQSLRGCVKPKEAAKPKKNGPTNHNKNGLNMSQQPTKAFDQKTTHKDLDPSSPTEPLNKRKKANPVNSSKPKSPHCIQVCNRFDPLGSCVAVGC